MDDTVIATNSRKLKEFIVRELKKDFDLTESDELRYILGVEVIQDRANGSITLTQQADKFLTATCGPTAEPTLPSINW